MIRKHSAKVLTLRNVVDGDRVISRHFVLIGGMWYYNGSSNMAFSPATESGFWTNFGVNDILKTSFPLTLERIKNAFYHGPNKSMQIATREWTTNQEVYGVSF